MFEPVLVADIGGTNARFAVATEFDKHTKQLELKHIKKLSSIAFSNFFEVVKAYLESIPTLPKRACLLWPVRAKETPFT